MPFDPVPEFPSYDEVLAARDDLLDVIVDFPWVSDVDRATWLAGVLTMLARQAIDGPTPVFVVTGNGPGAGKSLACKAAVMIATGRSPAMCAYQRREDEQMKTIASQLLASRQAVILDNVDCALGSPTLNLLWTSTSFEARLLSTNEAPSMPARIVWWASGNNITYYRDTPRRVAQMRMQADESPETREGFKHDDLLAFVKSRHKRLVQSALIMLRGAFVAGKWNTKGLKSWGSYESWSRVVRGSVVYAGLPDPIDGRVDVDDPDLDGIRALHEAWVDMPGGNSDDGVTAEEVLRVLKERPALFDPMRTLLADEFDGKPATARQLGALLKRRKDRVFRGMALVHCGKGKAGSRWAVRPVARRDGDSQNRESPVSHP